jgi:hypothetical protein
MDIPADGIRRQVHMTASLRGILQQPDKMLKGLFIDDDGKEIPPDELRELAVQKLREGYDVMPMCDNVDSRGYCQGHIIEGVNHGK